MFPKRAALKVELEGSEAKHAGFTRKGCIMPYLGIWSPSGVTWARNSIVLLPLRRDIRFPLVTCKDPMIVRNMDFDASRIGLWRSPSPGGNLFARALAALNFDDFDISLGVNDEPR